MCGIAGFCNVRINYEKNEGEWRTVLNRMKTVQKHRGPDEEGIFLGKHCGLAHVRLSIIDLASGRQPMVKREGGAEFAICYNGELYNMPELKKELLAAGESFQTNSDTEVILTAYLHYGKEFVKRLDGIFSFAIWDGRLEKIYLYRDRAGVKPCFYTIKEDTLIFHRKSRESSAIPGYRRRWIRPGSARFSGWGLLKPTEAVYSVM